MSVEPIKFETAEEAISFIESEAKAPYIVVSKDGCPYCDFAMELLEEKEKEFVVVKVTNQPERAKILDYYGRSTFPIILDSQIVIGGFKDLEKWFRRQHRK